MAKQPQRNEKQKEKKCKPEHFYSPVGSPSVAAAAVPRPFDQLGSQQAVVHQQQQQQGAGNVRVELAILPSPLRMPRRGKRDPGLLLAAARAAPNGSAREPSAQTAAAAQEAPSPAAAAAQEPVSAARSVPAASGRAPSGSAPASAERHRQQSSGGKRKPRRREHTRLTAKGKKAAVMGVVAESELRRAAAGAGGTAAAEPRSQQQRQPAAQLQQQAVQQQQQQQQQEEQPASPAADGAATANLGRSWSKADIARLARLAEDRAFLLRAIPGHPVGGELDWELISRHFGRYSRGGAAVRHQYYGVVRLMKQARHEGRKGASYVELVTQALASLPDRQGTIFEVQAVLKREQGSLLDKYRVKGVLRWKSAVREVLNDQPELFEQAGKTATNKIIWRLRQAAPA